LLQYVRGFASELFNASLVSVTELLHHVSFVTRAVSDSD